MQNLACTHESLAEHCCSSLPSWHWQTCSGEPCPVSPAGAAHLVWIHTCYNTRVNTINLIVTLKPDILIIPIPLSHGSPQFPHPHDIESPEEWVKGRVGNGPDHPDVVILLIHHQQGCAHPTQYHMQQEYQRGEGWALNSLLFIANQMLDDS